MTALDHKYNALLAMDYFIQQQTQLIEACKKHGFDLHNIEHQQKTISEMRASRKFIEENK